ncbi:MAG: hypothetical protein RR919_00020 [Bacteroidales bacterium]
MENFQEFYDFIIGSRQHFFIEAEGREDKIDRFIAKHNADYGRSINRLSDGICVLGDVDKWGVELRIYFNCIAGIPAGWHVQRNNIYRNRQYDYRLDSNEFVEFLFNKGCVLGAN